MQGLLQKVKAHWKAILSTIAAIAVAFATFFRDIVGGLKDLKDLFLKPPESALLQSPSPAPTLAPMDEINEKLRQQLQQLEAMASPSPTPTKPPSKPLTPTTLTPCEIVDAIRSQTPMMREEMAKQYIDVPVDWQLLFYNASLRDERIRVMANPKERLFPSVVFWLPSDRQGELKTLPQDAPIRLKGTIKEIDGLQIELDNAEMIIVRE
jgi:hypothetical protein